MDNRITAISELFKDKSIRVVGIVSDPNQGKSNVIYHCIQEIQKHASQTRIYSYGLHAQFEGVVGINSVSELEKISNGVIFVDEWADLVDTANRREAKLFERTIRTIYHPFKNNIIILCGLARNFNGRISGMLHAVIFKQTTLIDVVQRSTIYNVLKEYQGGLEVQKGSSVLYMPKNIALVYHPNMTKNYHEVEVPYVEAGDTKKNNPDIVIWNEEKKTRKG